MPLSPQQAAVLDTASGDAVREAWSRMDRYRGNSVWLGISNRYRRNTLQFIDRDWQGSNFKARNLAEYLAAAAFLHCVDGWAYLGRSLTAHLVGDEATSRHLAYYAELRAAMSILASQGIGIFNYKHVVIEASGAPVRLPNQLGTHNLTWLGLDHWSKTQRCGELLARTIRPGGIGIDEWLRSLRLRLPWRALGGNWTRTWGLDLRRLSEDRNLRNESSYRPTRLLGERSLDGPTSVGFAQAVWGLFEPWPDSTFEVMDRHLLRLSIEETWRLRRSESLVSGKYRAEVKRIIEEQAPPSPEAFERFLLRREGGTLGDSVFDIAGLRSSTDVPGQHREVLARAALLLRLSTGAVSDLIEERIEAENLAYWWEAVAEDLGFWPEGNPPDSLADLWADVADALEETRARENSPRSASDSIATSLKSFGECERVALWALAG